MPTWWIGCSGFHYKHWKNIFYPEGLPSTKWFDYYCEHFNAVELNVTFYRFPQVAFLKSFYTRSPKAMQNVADEIKGKRKSREVFIFFNNDIDVNAPRNAEEMKAITKTRIKAPA